MKYLKNKWVIFLLLPIFILVLLYLFRFPICRLAGNYLVAEDPLSTVDAVFVLSGSALPRGNEAARIYKLGYSRKIIFTGQELSIPGVPELGIDSVCTSELTQKFAVAAGVNPADTELLVKGTSTFEEFEAIREYCKSKQLKRIMVVSSNYHTRRIKNVFKNTLAKEGIAVIVRGAVDGFHPESWWKTESGLISLNNEYVKLVFYAFKY